MKRVSLIALLLAASVAFGEPLDDAKKLADDSLRLALQLQAASAGGDRGETHRAAEKKLQEGLEAFRKSTDVESYHHAADLAGQARALFEEAKPKAPAASPVSTPPAPPIPAIGAGSDEPKFESVALANARIAVQQYRRHLIEAGRPTAAAQRLEGQLTPSATRKTLLRVAEEASRFDRALSSATAKFAPARTPLEEAFRAYASGNPAAAEELLAKVRDADGLMLRGCARATRGMLSRAPEALLAAAATDFRAALQLDPKVALDPHLFSPKIIAIFERAKKQSL